MKKLKAKHISTKINMQKKARGYRLKPETHMLINKIQRFLKSDQDVAIASACSMYYAHLKKINTEK